jgi:hypothetical protein
MLNMVQTNNSIKHMSNTYRGAINKKNKYVVCILLEYLPLSMNVDEIAYNQ